MSYSLNVGERGRSGKIPASPMPTESESRFFRTPGDIGDLNPSTDIGRPGSFPFTRGIQPSMYRGRPWTMRQYAGFGTAAESNRRYHYLLAQGVKGLSVAFDLPTQIGYDADHPLAAGEVGRVGVSVATLEDMTTLFDGIPLDRVSTSMTINATAIILLALYVAVARRRGIALTQLAGTVQNDILKEYAARGTYIFPPRPSLRLVTDVIAFCNREVPQWNSISVSGYHIREAGSTAVQEVAFTLANGIAYVQAAIDAGLDVNTFGQRLSFFFNAHNDFLEEIAKFRAARRLWAHIMRDRFGAASPRAQQLRFHAQTAGSTLTARQTDNNIVRVSLQALAAVLGGTQSLHCNGFDEALALPTEQSATLALRTQQILLHESGVANTVDPVGGSYAIEQMTGRIAADAAALIARIDAAGGTLAAIESGFIQRQIHESAYRAQQAVDNGHSVVVGVNRYQSDDRDDGVDGTHGAEADVQVRPNAPIFTINPDIERQQIERLRAVRAGRSRSAWAASLEVVRRAAQSGENLVSPIIDAVEQQATLGEIADTLRGVFGEHQDVAFR
jgi:methylmalonyl-CoA mutase, N-terminal domain